MQYRKLGRTNIQISVVGLGTMSLPIHQERDAIDIIHRALDLGINFLDTADLYDMGRNEALVGKALRDRRAGVILATKVGNQWKADGSGWIWRPDKRYILQAVEISLQRLQTDYIDLYQLHGGTLEDPMDDIIDAFEILVAAGKIRHYGISSIRPNVIRRYASHPRLASVMIQYSLIDRRPEESVLELLGRSELGILSRGVLAKGLLAGKTSKDLSPSVMAEALDTLAALVKDDLAGNTHLALALGYVLKHPAVSSAVVGASQLKQIEACAMIADLPPLTEEIYAYLQNNLPKSVYTDHR